MASAKINSNTKPLIGVNTDVSKYIIKILSFKITDYLKIKFFLVSSEGHLLLPKKHSINFSATLKKLLDGNFELVSFKKFS